ncbi:MAG: hypothetical protein COA80_02555 [Leeuwenhoekiella sp.]|nr:MAG: hypothetical protein COA80_02555 [Leeuwenhoekiella sp.]
MSRRILFICGSIEPGKDGVGDYCRILATSLLKKGYKTEIVALYDKNSKSAVSEKQEYNGISVECLRIPRTFSFHKRRRYLKQRLFEFKPHWCSLQYVPYSFNPKGLPFELIFLLKPFQNSTNWNIMFHELQIALETKAKLKDKVIGQIQNILYKSLIRLLKPKNVCTQSKLYQKILSAITPSVYHLGLISNINPIATPEFSVNRNQNLLNIAVFGGIQENSKFELFLTWIQERANKKLNFLFIGNNGERATNWKRQLKAKRVAFMESGFLKDLEISEWLNHCDIGIATTPYLTIDKSGAVAAMYKHKLPVYCIGRQWEVKGYEKSIINIPNIHEWHSNSNLNLNFQENPSFYNINRVTTQLAEILR